MPLSVATLGVVFDDSGTGPFYAVLGALGEHYGLALTEANVLGVLSLIFWSLIVVISLKYQTLLLCADDRGGGGHVALAARFYPQSFCHGEARVRP